MATSFSSDREELWTNSQALLVIFDLIRRIMAVLCILANSFVIALIIKTKCFFENSANKFMSAILSVDLCFGVCFLFYNYDLKVN